MHHSSPLLHCSRRLIDVVAADFETPFPLHYSARRRDSLHLIDLRHKFSFPPKLRSRDRIAMDYERPAGLLEVIISYIFGRGIHQSVTMMCPVHLLW